MYVAKGSYREIIALIGGLTEGESEGGRKSGLGSLLGGVSNATKTVAGPDLDTDLPPFDGVESKLFSKWDLPVDLFSFNQLADER
ncbi:MAG: hypothetical protein P8L49_00005 [Opitutaceae bacterium]|nr:hypothetical protein [Opitutaceae bacterium]